MPWQMTLAAWISLYFSWFSCLTVQSGWNLSMSSRYPVEKIIPSGFTLLTRYQLWRPRPAAQVVRLRLFWKLKWYSYIGKKEGLTAFQLSFFSVSSIRNRISNTVSEDRSMYCEYMSYSAAKKGRGGRTDFCLWKTDAYLLLMPKIFHLKWNVWACGNVQDNKKVEFLKGDIYKDDSWVW